MISDLCFLKIAISLDLRLPTCGISGFATDFNDSCQHNRMCLELQSPITTVAAG